MAAALDWRSEESVALVRRSYAASLWAMVQQGPLDAEELVFTAKGAWKDPDGWRGGGVVLWGERRGAGIADTWRLLCKLWFKQSVGVHNLKCPNELILYWGRNSLKAGGGKAWVSGACFHVRIK